MRITIDIKKNADDPRRVLYEAYQNIDETLATPPDESEIIAGGLITDEETDEVLAVISIDRAEPHPTSDLETIKEDLIGLCEDNEVMKEVISEYFNG